MQCVTFWRGWIVLFYNRGMNYRRIFADGYSYYLTMVTQGRRPILIEQIDLLRRAFGLSRGKYRYRIDAIVILPDHLHMIITPELSTDYPKIISHIKRSFVYGVDKQLKEEAKAALSSAKHKRAHAGIWQERYYEHTIRNEKDLLEKLEYMYNNPVKHRWVENRETWKYSSFYKRSTQQSVSAI